MYTYIADDETHICEGDHHALIQTAASIQFKAMSGHITLILPLVAIFPLVFG